MLRKGQNHDPLKIELYDLTKDESESKDLSSIHPEIVLKIKDVMKKEHAKSLDFPISVID
jgi:hypothetical protein